MMATVSKIWLNFNFKEIWIIQLTGVLREPEPRDPGLRGRLASGLGKIFNPPLGFALKIGCHQFK